MDFDFVKAFTGMFQEGAPGEFVRQLQLFAMSFFKHAPAKFGIHLFGGGRCSRARCAENAVSVCLGCGDAVCLSHAWCSHEADVLCTKCARLAVRNISGGRSWGKGAKNAPDEPARGPVPIDHVTVAFMTLGLPQTATFEQVKKRFRMLTLRMHPDRVRGLNDEQQSDAEELFKRYSQAYSLLEKHLRKAA